MNPMESERKTAGEWIQYIEQFPLKINEVFLSGGEPTLLKDFAGLCNWILEKKYLLTVYTNLTNEHVWNKVIQSDRLRIQATFHGRVDKKTRFIFAYQAVASRHRVDVEEIAEQTLRFSKVKPWGCTVMLAKLITKNHLWISPTGKIFVDCYGVLKEET